MKVKWRVHGLVLVSLLTAISIAADFGFVYNFTGGDALKYGLHFANDHFTFNRYINIFLPQAGSVLLLYVAYLWVNRLSIRIFLSTEKKAFLTYLWALVQLLGISYLLALGINGASWYAHPSYFNYRGFQILSLFCYNDQPLQNPFAGFGRAIMLVSIYLAYAEIREYIIYKIEKPGPNKAYRTLVINQISTLLLVFITIPVLTLTFGLINSDIVYRVYFVLVVPAIIIYISNTYWLFPANKKPLFNFPLLIRLVVTTFIVNSIVFFCGVSFHLNPSGNLWIGCWGIQLFIITPITWLLYEQRKDKILQLRGAEKALTKSKADLQFLRSQINPHFLFNVLNTLYGTALREKAKDTAEGVQKLGDMMRFMLRDNHLDFIPMSSEIAYLKNYISLQKLRIHTAANVTIETNINDDNCGHLIVPMLLIPFVENAFKHGVDQLEKSRIRVNLSCSPQQISFTVCNSIFLLLIVIRKKIIQALGYKMLERDWTYFIPTNTN